GQEHFYFGAEINSYEYIDADDADYRVLEVDTGFKGKLQNKHRWRLGVDLRDSDKTYVSRFSAQPFTFRGQDASDRYDYERLQPYAKLDWKLSADTELELELAWRDQDYTDLTNLGLTNLSYQQWMLEASLEHDLSDKLVVSTFAEYRDREFDQRLAEDANGNDLPNTNSSYQYASVGFGLKYEFNDSTKISAKISYLDRSDNGGGFYEYDDFKASLWLRHKGNSKDKWTLYLLYGDLEYSRDIAINDPSFEANDEAPSRDGLSATLEYERELTTLWGGELNWYTSLRFYDYSSPNPVYTYDRLKIETGFKLSL
ncbi:MAG: hypothetical protein AAF197_12745, partial [Pseudomonadota bacterium]